MVDNYITEENVNSYFQFECIPKTIEGHLSNFSVYDLGIHNTDRARPFCISFYRLSKIAGRYDRAPTQEELQNSKKDTIVFAGDNCISTALDYCSKLKGEERKIKNKIVEFDLQLHAHNGSGFDTWIILINLDCDKHIVKVNKNGKGIIELKVFNGYSEKNDKQIPHYLHFRCGTTHLNYSLKKKLGKTFKLPKSFLKTERDQNDIDGDNYKDKKDIWLPYVKMDLLSTSYCDARYCGAMKKISVFLMKDSLSLPGLGFKYFKSLRTDQDEPIYTYNDKHWRHFLRQAAYGGRLCAFNQYYKSKICDDILNIISKELNVKGNTYEKIET